MGTALPPNEPGTDCVLCFGRPDSLGLITPKYITVNFKNVRPGLSFAPPAFLPNGDYRLQQINSCLWRVISPGSFSVEAGFAPTRTRVQFSQVSFSAVQWLGVVGAPCKTVIDDPDASSPAGVVFGGVITITWSTEGL